MALVAFFSSDFAEYWWVDVVKCNCIAAVIPLDMVPRDFKPTELPEFVG